ncbi:MAG: SUMF1/EgtB/PvdO family nonheme iron enzyme [Litoreibacter sp.]|uniref:formylglycine-generating enzyme family protein n=1 Tax=Litoreibacter sp. TaxID=1969459 RepID=UPI00329A6CAD
MKMIGVTSQSFSFGNTDAGASENRVTTTPFFMSEFPIDTGLWNQFVTATGYHHSLDGAETWDWGWTVADPQNGFDPLQPNHPAVGVCYADSLAFCAWLTELSGTHVRLPTEIEFEAAARAGCRCTTYCKSAKSVRDVVRQYGDNALRRPPSLNDKAANAFGLYSMHGHIWHWCSDVVNLDGEVPSTAALVMSDVARWDGKSVSDGRVIRGGSFAYPVEFACCVARSISRETDRNFNVGFRVVTQANAEVATAHEVLEGLGFNKEPTL